MAPAPLSKDKLLQPPVAPTGMQPGEDPAFAQVKGNVKGFAKAKKDHPPAASKAKEAQDAALPPTDDVAGQAKAAKVDTMDAQPAGTFDKKAFIAAVKTAIEAKSPKTLKEADNYKESGKAGEVKGEVKGMVTEGKEGSAKDIEGATEAAPDESKAVPKEVTPLAQEDPGKVAAIPAAGAVPKPVPAEQVNLEAGKHEANQEMADANVSEDQLAKSNEPEFQGALADKKKAAEHADTAPGEYRQEEKETIAQGKGQAAAETTAGVAGMQGAKGAALAKLVAAKGKTKSKDEAKRAEVTTKIQSIFAATEADVKKILDGIDPKVDKEFETGEAAAKAKFESYVAAKMSAYKKDRYGGWLGGLRWAKDKLLGMPDKVNEFYEAGRELYLKEMDGVISRVADIVGGDLTAAKQRIAKGRDEISAYVKTLSPDLQKVGNEAAQEIGEKFEQLESDVNDKQNEVVETLASKYVEARKGLDERIEALQAENKGLVDKAIGAIKAVINTIRELASMLKNALARAASVIGDIIGDPIGFLGNLIGGIKGGIDKFFANIGAHLKKGLMGWLFGQLANAGIELPETFDLKGIIKLLASIFGLTWANIRNRIIMQIGEKAMDGGRGGRRHLPEAQGSRGRRPVGDAAGEARQHQRHDHGAGRGLRPHQDHHRRHHLADQPAQPGRRLHQGLQADLRRGDVLRHQRLADREVRQHRHRRRRRHRQGQRLRGGRQDRGRAQSDGADPDRLHRQRPGHRRHRREDPLDHPEAPEAGHEGRRLRDQDRPEARRPDHPRPQGNRRQGQGEDRLRQGVREGQGRRGQGVGEGEGRGGEKLRARRQWETRRKPFSVGGESHTVCIKRRESLTASDGRHRRPTSPASTGRQAVAGAD